MELVGCENGIQVAKQDWTRIFEPNLWSFEFQHYDFYEYGGDMGKKEGLGTSGNLSFQ